MKKAPLLLITLTACAAALGITAAPAQTTYNGTSTIAFDRALTVTKNNDINFGLVKAAQAGTYAISTAGVVTPSGGGVVEGGTPVVGNISISGSSTQGLTISATTYTANGGVTPSAARGKYGAGAEQALPISVSAPGAGTTLLLGVTVSANGTQADGSTSNPTITIDVIYQ